MGGLYLGQNWSAETTEPYFQVASAVLIVGIALWMLWRTRKEQVGEAEKHGHGHAHAESRLIDTGHGVVELEIFEDGAPPRFRARYQGADPVPTGQSFEVETIRPDGTRQGFAMRRAGALLESVDEIPEPHEFTARLTIAHGDHRHDYEVAFSEDGYGHAHGAEHGLDVSSSGFQDAHEREHASDIKRRFASRKVTTGQIIGFGLTGGLIPCPAAITVLLLCLQLKRFTLGASLVLCFSIGLAITMVAAGVIAALGVRHASSRWSGLETFARRAPYASSGLIIMVGLYVGYQGIVGLGAAGVL